MIGLVGAGAMGGALLSGWLAAGWPVGDFIVAETNAARRAELSERGIRCGTPDEAAAADTLVLAVKPQQMSALLEELRPEPETLVVSVAAGVPLERLERAWPDSPVVRVMPNTGALVGEAMSGLILGARATDGHLARARRLFDAVGRTVVTDEAHLDALTALSGSGPAYLFYVADALIEAGVHQGLTREQSRELVAQTFVGAAKLLADSPATAVELREQVTSPKGTTAAALRKLDDHGVRAAFLAAVEACAHRSAEMGRSQS
ncbi:pyrroline-5-carboxylate reductase [Tessaracoccus sp. OH4464_COT-324]|uniref:pyrroline-5-carboxylate reductase n=1 Tax=Tessaracoccus sp. OH4464_COT-324 TaxID=2491059 RepID=UPI000F64091A|nr:pyrroline-5-carboxylate reductase [Tessaracoccus sp. OH4464_COT-324]RRD45825.1 pyrroline-5-carboxylate reductase [Tessaracoccus sp. OH4464_COT-324]